jgi:hypothetical protein
MQDVVNPNSVLFLANIDKRNKIMANKTKDVNAGLPARFLTNHSQNILRDS